MSRTIRFKIGRAKNSIVSVLEGNDEKKLNRRKSLTRDHGAPWANVEIPYYNLPDDPRSGGATSADTLSSDRTPGHFGLYGLLEGSRETGPLPGGPPSAERRQPDHAIRTHRLSASSPTGRHRVPDGQASGVAAVNIRRFQT